MRLAVFQLEGGSGTYARVRGEVYLHLKTSYCRASTAALVLVLALVLGIVLYFSLHPHGIEDVKCSEVLLPAVQECSKARMKCGAENTDPMLIWRHKCGCGLTELRQCRNGMVGG